MASTADAFRFAEAMQSPAQDHWRRVMEEEVTSIMLNNTFSTLKSEEAQLLQVRLVRSTWVYMTKCNTDRSTWYKAWLVIKGYKQTN